ncbi:MAG: cytochrome C oxidase subunit IV family protein [Myxococcota bacterium]
MLPLPFYIGVWLALLVFTAITVAVSYVDFGIFNLVIALTVATMKAAMVSLIFMHLAFDKKFNGIIFVSSLVFLAIFIGFTMADTEGRGLAEGIEAKHPRDITNPFTGTEDEPLPGGATSAATSEAKSAAPSAGASPTQTPPAQGGGAASPAAGSPPAAGSNVAPGAGGAQPAAPQGETR